MELLLTKLWLLHDSSRPYGLRRPKLIYKEAQEPIYFMTATMQSNCKEKHKALGIQPLKPNPPANHQIGGCDERHKTPESLQDWSIPSSHKYERRQLKTWSENGD